MDGCSRPVPVRPCAGTGDYGFGQRSCGGRHRRRHHCGRRHYEGYDLRCGRRFFDRGRTGQCAGRVVHGLSVPHDQGGVANPDRRRAERGHAGHRRRDRRGVRYREEGGLHRFGRRHQVGRHHQVAAVQRGADIGRKGRRRTDRQHLGTAGREPLDSHPRLQLAQRRQRPAVDRGRYALFGRPEQPQPERHRVDDRAEGRRLERSVRRPRRQRRGDDHHQKSQVAGGPRDDRRQVGRQFARRPGLCVHHQPGAILRTALQRAEKLLHGFGYGCRRGASARQ